MTAFMKRNLKLYLRDRAAVAFSLLAVVIVIALYVLFLGDVYTNDLGAFEGAKEMMDSWVMAGVLAITSLTTTLGMLGNLVRDREQKIVKDFYIAPVKKWQLAGGYLLSAYLVGVIMSVLAFGFAEVYITANGGELLKPEAAAGVIGMILLTSFMNTSVMLFVVTLLKSLNAFSTVSTIIGTLIGFLTGIYLPIGMLPEAVQWVIRVFPVSHAALVFRNLMMGAVMESAFAGAPEETATVVKEQLGIVYSIGSKELPIGFSVILILLVGILFFGASCVRMTEKDGNG